MSLIEKKRFYGHHYSLPMVYYSQLFLILKNILDTNLFFSRTIFKNLHVSVFLTIFIIEKHTKCNNTGGNKMQSTILALQYRLYVQ